MFYLEKCEIQTYDQKNGVTEKDFEEAKMPISDKDNCLASTPYIKNWFYKWFKGGKK